MLCSERRYAAIHFDCAARFRNLFFISLLTDVHKLLLSGGVEREWVTPGYSEDLTPHCDFDFKPVLTIKTNVNRGLQNLIVRKFP